LFVSGIPKDIKDAKVISLIFCLIEFVILFIINKNDIIISLEDHFEKFGEIHSVLLCYDIRDYSQIQIDLYYGVFQVFFFFSKL
jgi:hypothetical protein